MTRELVNDHFAVCFVRKSSPAERLPSKLHLLFNLITVLLSYLTVFKNLSKQPEPSSSTRLFLSHLSAVSVFLFHSSPALTHVWSCIDVSGD